MANALGKALLFLEQLEGANIHYQLEHIRDALTIVAAVPGQRWEIEFFEGGHVEVEHFISSGEIERDGQSTGWHAHTQRASSGRSLCPPWASGRM